MRIYKVYELSSEVKLDLTQDNIDDILDLFELEIVDKYQMKRININQLDFQYNLHTAIPDVEKGSNISNYSYIYNNSNRVFELVVKCSPSFKMMEFIKDMKLLKERLKKHEFIVAGHAVTYVNHYRGSNRNRRYYLSVYKPMFPVRKRKK